VTRLLAIATLGITLGAALLAAILYQEPQLLGSDEVNYVNLQPITLKPGQYVTQPVDVQAPDLSRISFLYSFQASGSEVVHVTIRSAGRIVVDRELTVSRSLPDQSPARWWVGSQWDSAARFQPVPVAGPVEGRVVVTIAVPPSSQPLVLWWSPPKPAQPHLIFGPPNQDSPGKGIAIRTEYGPVQPAIAKMPTFVDRVARYGALWLPAPGLWALIVLFVLVAGGLVCLVSPDSRAPSETGRV
jgi:hypothetical protein